MNVVSFLGSPRKQGMTAEALGQVLAGIQKEHEATSDLVFLQEKNIHPCTGCHHCKTTKEGKCILKDDMVEMMDKIETSEVLIFATPIYWWSVTAQLKLLIDRLYALDFRNRKEGKAKKIVLIMTYGGPLPNSGPETVEALFREVCQYLKVDLVGVLGICTGEMETIQNTRHWSEAYDFGKHLSFS